MAESLAKPRETHFFYRGSYSLHSIFPSPRRQEVRKQYMSPTYGRVCIAICLPTHAARVTEPFLFLSMLQWLCCHFLYLLDRPTAAELPFNSPSTRGGGRLRGS